MVKPYVYLARQVPKEVEAYIAQHCRYRMWDSEEPIPADVLQQEIKEAEGLIPGTGLINDDLLSMAPKLRIVSNVAVGYNNFDLDAMKRRGVIGTHTPHVLDETVADLVFALILSVARRVPELDRLVKEGRWHKGSDEPMFGLDVHHTRLGIIGMGRIGEAIARRARYGFGMEVVYYNRSAKPEAERELGVKRMELEQLLRESDFVVLMVPLTAHTEKFIGAEQFAMMKETAFFINASRGRTVDEAALIDALKQGRIGGAGLDVFEREPVDPANPLLQMPNVVTLPHIGSATHKTRFDMAMVAARNLVMGVAGEQPPNVVPELSGG